ncbi:hypothetical protein GYMLUDRAFT_65399 [Collybiopsis luxurians FD-317 M1]|uniref:Uncharacterized protein n=1 Tax=Collybiopsis luxurians FD-317 M1 TaxID=944289 RepID=A0A0D0B7R9_9AGAR|nr:hypothetical protein GYMLUDRAFT_65399 [Collybiopsis luxurians FD-317 M1]
MPKDLHKSKVTQKESKHARYYTRHREERKAQSRDYKRDCKVVLKAQKQGLVIASERNTNPIRRSSIDVPSVPAPPQLLVKGNKMMSHSMYQDFITLRNKIDDWVERTRSHLPAMKTSLVSNFPLYLFTGAILATDLHLFLDKYGDIIPSHYLDVWRFHKSVCGMQLALGSGRAQLVLEIDPDMAIPQPNWADVTFWVPQDSTSLSVSIHKRLSLLHSKADRFNVISSKLMHSQIGQWTYEEIERCIQLGQKLYMDWYTVLDDLDDDFTSIWGICPFLKETSHTVYKIGQTLEKLTYLLPHLSK